MTALRTAAQQALEALSLALTDVDWRAKSPTQPVIHRAYAALRAALAQQEQAAGWRPISEPYEPRDVIDILMGDGSVLCAVLPQFDGDLWWEGSGTGEKFIDPERANVTHWRPHAEAALAQQEQADETCFCDRNGLGEPGVSCGDCPTRDYKRPAQQEQAVVNQQLTTPILDHEKHQDFCAAKDLHREWRILWLDNLIAEFEAKGD